MSKAPKARKAEKPAAPQVQTAPTEANSDTARQYPASQSANTQAVAKPKHRPETIAKRMADRAAEMVGQHNDTPFAAWDEATASQQAWWTDLAKTAHAD